jgi:hypothetical protein
VKQAFFYLHFAYRRFVRAKDKDRMGEWKARFLLLWVQAQCIVCLLALADRQWAQSINPYIGGAIVIVPCYIWTEYLLSDRHASLRYTTKFKSWPPQKRYIVDSCVIVLTLLILFAPLLIA